MKQLNRQDIMEVAGGSEQFIPEHIKQHMNNQYFLFFHGRVNYEQMHENIYSLPTAQFYINEYRRQGYPRMIAERVYQDRS